MYDYIRVSTAVPSISVGDTIYNTEKICEKIRQAAKQGSCITLLPELAVTGYTCADLFFQKTLLDGAIRGLESIIDTSAEYKMLVIVGAPLKIKNCLYNAACVIADGTIKGISVKTFIPNHGEFSEKRWFSSADDLSVQEIDILELGIEKYGSYKIPVGNDLVFNLNNSVKFGIEICKDALTAAPPSTFLSLAGAEVIFNPSAINEIVGKRAYRRDTVKAQSARTLGAYVLVSAGAEESTTDLVFSGHSLCAQNGVVIAENSKLCDSDYILTFDIDTETIRNERLKNNSFADSAKHYATLCSCRQIDIISSFINTDSDGSLCKVSKLPFVPETKQERIDICSAIFEMQVAALKKRTEITGSKLVVGVSGGLDSTLALLVATETMRRLGRPLTDVVGITMPCFGTSGRTYSNSLELMKTLGITGLTIDIKQSCIGHFNDIGHDMSKLDATYENSQARERTQVLMDYAGSIGGFVVGTGDLSELALGWCTYNGDQMSMYGINAGVPKTLIRWIIDTVAQFDVFKNSAVVLKDILDTPISPELLPPDATGTIAQVTEDIIGPYALHDFFLYYIIRFGYSPSKIYHLAKRAFKDDFRDGDILKWLKVFYKRFFTQQFKRSAMPDGVKIGLIGLSPRGDFKMPSDASAKLWLAEIEKL